MARPARARLRDVRPAVPARALLVLFDVAVLTIVAIANWQWRPGGGRTAAIAAIFLLTTMLVVLLRNRHRAVLRRSTLDGVTDGVKTVAAGAGATFALLALFGPTTAHEQVSVLLLAVTAAIAIGAGRVSAAGAERRSRHRGQRLSPVVILGTGEVGTRVAQLLVEYPEYGLRPAGFIDADPFPLADRDGALPPYLGGPTALADALEATGSRHVVVAFSTLSDDGLMSLMRRCQELGVEVSVVPRFADAMHCGISLEHIGALPIVRVPAARTRGWEVRVKHAADRVGAAVMLAALAPALIALALLIRRDSPGPILFHQRRVGRDGVEFDLLKFRSMRAAETGGVRFALADGSAPGGVEGADRRTPFGRWLRRSSLDELPQLLNVLFGEMSIVGPRPERPEFVSLFGTDVRRYADRHRVRAGITGWAQVNGLRGQTSIAKRVEWDNYYIENFALSLDMKIMLLTVKALFRAPPGED